MTIGGRRLVGCAVADGTVTLADPATGQARHTLRTEPGQVRALVPLRLTGTACVGIVSADGSLTAWAPEQGWGQTFTVHSGRATAAARLGASSLAVGGSNGRVAVWAVGDLRPQWVTPIGSGPVAALCTMPGLVAAADADGRIHLLADRAADADGRIHLLTDRAADGTAGPTAGSAPVVSDAGRRTPDPLESSRLQPTLTSAHSAAGHRTPAAVDPSVFHRGPEPGDSRPRTLNPVNTAGLPGPVGSGRAPRALDPIAPSALPRTLGPVDPSTLRRALDPGDASALPRALDPDDASTLPQTLDPSDPSTVPRVRDLGDASALAQVLDPSDPSTLPPTLDPAESSALPRALDPDEASARQGSLDPGGPAGLFHSRQPVGSGGRPGGVAHDGSTGRPGVLDSAGGPVRALCPVAAGDRTLLAAAGDAGVVSLWDLTTGGRRHQLIGHSGPVTAVCEAPGGLLASAGTDRTVRLWDPLTGECRMTIPLPHEPTACLAAGDHLIVGSTAGTIAYGLEP